MIRSIATALVAAFALVAFGARANEAKKDEKAAEKAPAAAEKKAAPAAEKKAEKAAEKAPEKAAEKK